MGVRDFLGRVRPESLKEKTETKQGATEESKRPTKRNPTP